MNGGFRLGGQTARQLGIRMLRASQRPILPGTVDRTLGIPGRNGVMDFGADMGARQFNLECAALKQSPAALQQVVTSLAAYLVDQYGKPRTLPLIFDYQPGRLYYVRYSGSLPVDRIVGLGQFTLPLVAFDSYAYAVSDSLLSDMITTSPWEVFIESDGTVVTPTYIELTNEGTTTITTFTIQNEFFLEG